MFVSSVATAPLRVPLSHLVYFFRRAAGLLPALLLIAACDSQPSPPVQTVPLTYAGSASCNECHATEYARWQTSHHALAMLPASEDTVRGDFADREFTYFGFTSRFFTDEGKFFVRTDNAAGEAEDFEIRYTFGVEPLQQYLVEMPKGHIQALPLAWDSRPAADGGQRWYHLYPDEPVRHDDRLHWTGRDQNWNYMCAECHSTNLDKGYASDSDSFATTWSEINVGCEGCHGPASRHIARARSGAGAGGLVVDLDDHGRAIWQMNTQTGIAERSEILMRPPQQPEACGRCHARRSLATGDYAFGRPLHDTHVPALLDEGLYYPDGQILEEVYVYGSFLQSRMYRAGVTCSDCHDPHAATLRSTGAVSNICSTCHLPSVFAAESHHRHPAGAVQCVDCHMPQRTYMGVDDRRDHSFRIPRPDLTAATGSPNACNGCHDDRDTAWAVNATEAWYGARGDVHYAEAIHAGRSGAPLANLQLLAAAGNEQYPGIARATALTLLRPPISQQGVADLRQRLADGDSLIRAAAVEALPGTSPEILLDLAPPLLSDPVRSVRIAAARSLSPLQGSLSGAAAAAFAAANEERRAAQLAIAERPEAHLNLGNLYADAGNPAQAEAEFRHALRLEPMAVAARVNLAQLYSATGRSADAEQVLREGIAVGVEEGVLRHSLGLLLVRGGQVAAAMPELKAAADLHPDEARFAYVYAVALHSTGQADEAIARLRQGATRFPADYDIHWALATMLRDAGRTAEARQVAETLVENFPGNEDVQNLLRSL